MSDKPEVWLRGPLPGIPPLLQPVAHALMQAKEEVNTLMEGFPVHLLWEKPAGMASPAYHLQHLRGVIDRLFTYADGAQLDDLQLAALAAEGIRDDGTTSATFLLAMFNSQVDAAIEQLRQTDETTLTETREVGRAKMHSTVIGLYVHAAEHTMRHVGQLLVTVKVLQAGGVSG